MSRAILAATAATLALSSVACQQTEEEKLVRDVEEQVHCIEGRKSACERQAARTKERCASGDPDGCVLLGIMHQGGQDVPKDEAEAVRLFQRACDAKNGSGCWYLGNAHKDGRGTPPSLERARDAYQESCALKRENGCISLGDLLAGPGALHDRDKALAAYDAACAIPYQGGCERAAAFRASQGDRR